MSEAKPPRRPGGRRPVPPLIFLLVLAILALAVWWKVIRTDEDKQVAANAPCTLTATPEQLNELQNWANIKVKVLNGSGQKGLAASIGGELTARGFSVLEIGNADLDEPLTTAGTVNYGTGYEFAAKILAEHMTDFDIERSSHLTDGTLIVTAGEGYKGMGDPMTIQPVINDLVAAQGKIVAGCPSTPATD